MAGFSNFPLTAIAQVNFTVGDISGNCNKILEYWHKATSEGAELVVFPELSVCGYCPEDLVLMPEFCKKSMQAVYDIAEKTSGGAAIILGSVWKISGKVYNAAIVIDGGEILHIQPKHILPNYGVFDEKRQFSAGNMPSFLKWRGHKIGILICEDMWDDFIEMSFCDQAVEAVFAINASPFEIDKHKQRVRVAAKAARISVAPVVYVNMVGGQDEMVFDGGSFVINPDGKVILELPRFQENILFIKDEPEKTEEKIYDKEWEIWNAMKMGLSDYVKKNGFSRVLLGLSGGIDSAVTAALAVDALGKENVLGVLLPSPYTSKESIEDARKTINLLGIEERTIAITEPMEVFYSILTPEFAKEGWMEEPEIGGNLQARIRAVILMGISNRYGGLLLSTGNKSEIAVGYSTLYGDSCGGYNVLKDVYKTDVYRLAKWRNRRSQAIPERSISKAPSAELKPNQRDEDNLPPYDILDDILYKHIELRLGIEEIIALGHDKDVAEKVLRMVRISEYKRRQSTIGVKISPMLFGKDRRYPLTNKF